MPQVLEEKGLIYNEVENKQDNSAYGKVFQGGCAEGAPHLEEVLL